MSEGGNGGFMAGSGGGGAGGGASRSTFRVAPLGLPEPRTPVATATWTYYKATLHEIARALDITLPVGGVVEAELQADGLVLSIKKIEGKLP